MEEEEEDELSNLNFAGLEINEDDSEESDESDDSEEEEDYYDEDFIVKPKPPLPLYEVPYEIPELPIANNIWNINLPNKNVLKHFNIISESRIKFKLLDEIYIQSLLSYFSRFEQEENQAGINNNTLLVKEIYNAEIDGRKMNHCLMPFTFDSQFESGNLLCVNHVIGRQEMHDRFYNTHYNSTSNENFKALEPVSHEFDCYLRNDLFTLGNTQWYYFSVTNNEDYLSEPPGKEYDSVKKIFKSRRSIRISIRNLMKKDSLYNYGMQPCVFSEKEHELNGTGWIRDCRDIVYYRTSDTYVKKKNNHKNYYALTFTYDFKHANDCVYFAHCFPYTYSDLNLDIQALQSDENRRTLMRRRTLATSLGGNQIDIITVTSPCIDPEIVRKRKVIVISARVHPGETNSSFMMRGILNFITGESEDAKLLRELVVFKVVPMINPDGVIHGNYRCSLSGRDLNRKWMKPKERLYPAISKLKELLLNLKKSRHVVAFLDLHGHSRKKNVFSYGCINKVEARNNIDYTQQSYLLPYLFYRLSPSYADSIINFNDDDSSVNGKFSFKSSDWEVKKQKRSTARVVCWRDIGIVNSFTIEASFCGSGDNEAMRILEKENMYFLNSKEAIDVVVPPASACLPPLYKKKSTILEEEGVILSNNNTKKKDDFHFDEEDFQDVGKFICLGVLEYVKSISLSVMPKSSKNISVDEYLNPNPKRKLSIKSLKPMHSFSSSFLQQSQNDLFRLLQSNILNFGTPLLSNNDLDDDGSDSDPSVNNIDEVDLKKDNSWIGNTIQKKKVVKKKKSIKNVNKIKNKKKIKATPSKSNGDEISRKSNNSIQGSRRFSPIDNLGYLSSKLENRKQPILSTSLAIPAMKKNNNSNNITSYSTVHIDLNVRDIFNGSEGKKKETISSNPPHLVSSQTISSFEFFDIGSSSGRRNEEGFVNKRPINSINVAKMKGQLDLSKSKRKVTLVKSLLNPASTETATIFRYSSSPITNLSNCNINSLNPLLINDVPFYDGPFSKIITSRRGSDQIDLISKVDGLKIQRKASGGTSNNASTLPFIM